ncbi:CGNR zinc finger domain-containing protein [Streptomyces sp. NPDC053755]|uniref:CGNR zinc finger domain-containing protein n=1 Tax=Streptomyces sp. NPDC053755 TaxID=3155815 RepID=UPI0034298DC1
MSPHAPLAPHPPAEGPPLLGEPLALEFVNTHYAVRGCLRDGLAGTRELAWWLWACRERFATVLSEEHLARIGPSDVMCFQQLRDAARRLIEAQTLGQAPDPRDIAQVNRAGGLGRSWPVLVWENDGRPHAVPTGACGPLLECQAELAHETVRLITSPTLTVKPCLAPGCVLYFERTPPRREWCSPGCGNRARAARHYNRHRNPTPPPAHP